MPRRKIELSNLYPYHVCARSNNQDWFNLPLGFLFGIYANIMNKTIESYNIRCHSFVLLANHFHMIVSTPEKNLSAAMRFFMTETSRAIARNSGRINRIYGARYHWTIIKSSEHFAHAYSYVYRNPVKHGAITELKNYKWSTLYPYHKKFSDLISKKKESYYEYIPSNINDLLLWLNQCQDPFYEDFTRRALKKHCFAFGQDKNSGKRPRFFDKLHPKNTPGT